MGRLQAPSALWGVSVSLSSLFWFMATPLFLLIHSNCCAASALLPDAVGSCLRCSKCQAAAKQAPALTEQLNLKYLASRKEHGTVLIFQRASSRRINKKSLKEINLGRSKKTKTRKNKLIQSKHKQQNKHYLDKLTLIYCICI